MASAWKELAGIWRFGLAGSASTLIRCCTAVISENLGLSFGLALAPDTDIGELQIMMPLAGIT